LYYEVQVADFDYTPTEECRELKFFTPEEALQEDLWSAVRKTFEEGKEIFKEF